MEILSNVFQTALLFFVVLLLADYWNGTLGSDEDSPDWISVTGGISAFVAAVSGVIYITILIWS